MPASPLDTLLVILAGVTAALILWKGVILYLPGLLGRRRAELVPRDELELDELLEGLEHGLPWLATLAATAPFLGLAATVLHIRAALTLVGGATPDTAVIAGPIATALGSTLLGLASAIPAAAAYNLYVRRVQLVQNRVRRRLAREAAVERLPEGEPVRGLDEAPPLFADETPDAERSP